MHTQPIETMKRPKTKPPGTGERPVPVRPMAKRSVPYEIALRSPMRGTRTRGAIASIKLWVPTPVMAARRPAGAGTHDTTRLDLAQDDHT